jgi:hypothetical protein
VQSGRHGELAPAEHWEAFHSGRGPRLRLPSPLVIATRNLHGTLRRYVEPGMSVLEIGFAPGKHLAFVASALHANVTGVDFSENGVRFARRLFETLRLDGDLRCENVFETSVIEHFADPTEIVRRTSICCGRALRLWCSFRITPASTGPCSGTSTPRTCRSTTSTS